MSQAILYCVPKKGPLKEFSTYENAHRGALFIWKTLGQYYLGWGPDEFPQWGNRLVCEIPNLDWYERALLMICTDRGMYLQKDLHKVADAIHKFKDRHGTAGLFEEACLDYCTLAHDGDCYAACWQLTSVYSDQWTIGNRYYDISRDTGHWFVDWDRDVLLLENLEEQKSK